MYIDSTIVAGNYPDADGRKRGGQPSPAIRHCHNNDHRPDLKQLLFILTICTDGAVLIAYRVADDKTVDDLTHIPTRIQDQLTAEARATGARPSLGSTCRRAALLRGERNVISQLRAQLSLPERGDHTVTAQSTA